MTNEAVYQGEFYFSLDVFSICLDLLKNIHLNKTVVICFHFSIFVLLETAVYTYEIKEVQLWFAFILVSLSYWKQHE